MKNKQTKIKKIRTKFLISLFVILCLLVLGFVYIELVVNPIIVNIAEAQVDSVATTAISDAIFEVITDENINYEDLISVSYDKDNKINSITSNMEKMNYLAREISTRSQILLDEIGQYGAKVALGAFTGLEILTTVGPLITLRMMPIGSVITTFNSSFDTAGINQTKHSIYIDVNTSISVVLPTSSKKITFVTSALVCESIIVGSVPDVYVNGNLVG